jgi:hypothetical protein
MDNRKELGGLVLTSTALIFAIVGLSTSRWRVSEVDDDGHAIDENAYPPNVDATAYFGLHDATLANITCTLSWLARCFPVRRSQSIFVITSDEQESIESATKSMIAFGILGVLSCSIVWTANVMAWRNWKTACWGCMQKRHTPCVNSICSIITSLTFMLGIIIYAAVFPSLSTRVATFTWGYSFILMVITTPLLVISAILFIIVLKGIGADAETTIMADLWEWITSLAVEDWEPAPIIGLITGVIIVTSVALGSDCWVSPSQVCDSNTVRFGLRQAGLVNETLYLEDWQSNRMFAFRSLSCQISSRRCQWHHLGCWIDGMNPRVKYAADVVLTFAIAVLIVGMHLTLTVIGRLIILSLYFSCLSIGLLTIRVLLLVMWGRIESRGRCPVVITFIIGIVLLFSVSLYAAIFPDAPDINIYYPSTLRTVSFGTSYPILRWGWGFWLLLTVGLICISPVFGWAAYKLLVRMKEMTRDEVKRVSAAVLLSVGILAAIIGVSTICWRVSTVSCTGDSFGLLRASFRGLSLDSSAYSAFDSSAVTASSGALVLVSCGFGIAFPALYTSVLCAMGRAQRWKGRVEIIAITCCFLTSACWCCAPLLFGITWPTIRTMDIRFANSTFGLNLPTDIDTGAAVYDLGPTPLQWGYSFGLVVTASAFALMAGISLLVVSELRLKPMPQPVPGQIPTFTDISPPEPHIAANNNSPDSNGAPSAIIMTTVDGTNNSGANTLGSVPSPVASPSNNGEALAPAARMPAAF